MAHVLKGSHSFTGWA